MALTFMLANNSVTKNVKLLPLHLRTGDSALLNLPQTTRPALFIDSIDSETRGGGGTFQQHRSIHFKA